MTRGEPLRRSSRRPDAFDSDGHIDVSTHRGHLHRLRRLTSRDVAVTARVAMIVADILVIAATWIKLYRTVRDTRDLQLPVTASAVLLTDGMSNAPDKLEIYSKLYR